MAIIAKITAQQKRRGRYNIFLQEGSIERYAFSVTEDVLIKYDLKKGRELDEDHMRAVLSAEAYKQAERLALRYLSYRMRSEKELCTYLQQKACEATHIEEVVTRFKQEKWLDDVAFAKAFVQTKINTTLIGPNKLRHALMEKGVAESAQEVALAIYDRTQQKQCVSAWLEKQLVQAANVRESKQMRKQKWTNRLLAKGFTFELVQTVLEEVTSEDEANDWASLCYQAEKVTRTYARRFDGFTLQQKVKQALYRKGFSFSEIDRYIDEEWQERG
ncbi:recombination regulator RecX [Bacillus sp. FSL W7-1360]